MDVRVLTVSKAHRETTAAILSTIGDEIYVDDEKYLDMATALSASGPAYVFMILEAMIDAGVYVASPGTWHAGWLCKP